MIWSYNKKVVLLASSLQQCNLQEESMTANDTEIYKMTTTFLKMENNLFAYSDVNGLMTSLRIEYNPQD